MRVLQRNSLCLLGALVAFSVLWVPTVRAQECTQDADFRRDLWRKNYSEYLGDGKFLDSWSSFPGCLELPAPGDEVTLKLVQIQETEERITMSSSKTLYLDSSTFGELAYAILLAAQKKKPLLWELDSYGGWLEVTLVLLDLFHKAGVPVDLVISEKSICYSSCLLLAAGVERTFAHPNATFGFHGASLGDKHDAEGTDMYVRLLIQMGVSTALLETLREQGVFDSGEFHLMRASQLSGSGLFKDFLQNI